MICPAVCPALRAAAAVVAVIVVIAAKIPAVTSTNGFNQQKGLLPQAFSYFLKPFSFQSPEATE